MTSSAVIQVKRGIGDVIWHLPFVRAIAGVSPGGKVTFLAPPSSGAKDLLAAEPSIATTLYFAHAGSELQRGINLIRLAALLRRQRFGSVWILDRTMRPALAARLAGVPQRIGLGLGAQKLFITNPGVAHRHFHDHPIDWLRALMAAMNVPLPSTEPALPVRADVREAVATKFSASPRPWIVLGLGAMDPARDWSDACWLAFLSGVRAVTNGTVFLIGGPANTARAQGLITRSSGAAAINACKLGLGEALALLSCADLFVGTDSGPMNLAAAVGTPAFVMFGVNRVLDYSKFIHPIVPDGGPCPDGMAKITPAMVLEHIQPLLRRSEGRAGNA